MKGKMSKQAKLYFYVGGAVLLFMLCTNGYTQCAQGEGPFTISAEGTPPSKVEKGETVYAYFKVTNNLSKSWPGEYISVKHYPKSICEKKSSSCQNITQVYAPAQSKYPDLCKAPRFTLPPHGSCTLQLAISGAVQSAAQRDCGMHNAADLQRQDDRLWVCLPDGQTCAGNSDLNVKQVPVIPFTIVPIEPLPTTVYIDQTTTASYIVKNNSGRLTKNNFVKYLPIPTHNIKQVINAGPGNCGKSFDLTAKGSIGDSCKLELLISGAVQSGLDQNDRLGVCLSDGKTCVRNSELNVKQISLPIKMLAVGSILGKSPLSYTSDDSGVTWNDTSKGFPPGSPGEGLNGVSCYRDCVAVGNPYTYVSHDNGKNWLSLSLLNPADNFYGVSCVSGTCVTVGTGPQGEPFSFTLMGDWVASDIKRTLGDFLNAIACDNTTHCVAVGNNAGTIISYYTPKEGITWTKSKLPDLGSVKADLKGIACDSTGKICTAVGVKNGNVPLSYSTSDGGISWALSAGQPSGKGILTSIACDSSGKKCTAVGAYNSMPLLYYTTNAAARWSVSQLDKLFLGELYGVACDSKGLLCAAIGDSAVPGSFLSYTSQDGGAHWSNQQGFMAPANGHLASITVIS